MLRAAVILILLTFCACNKLGDHEDHGHEDHESEWMEFLEEENISEDEREKWLEYMRRGHEHPKEDYQDILPISWEEALGYEECDDFKDDTERHHHGDHTGRHHGNHEGHHHGHHDRHHHKKHRHGDSHNDQHNDVDDSHHPESAANCDVDGHHRKHSLKPKSIEEICDTQSECPNFVDIEHNDCGFGARLIEGGKWVETKVDLDNVQGWILKSFFRLFRYINGHNEDGVEMDMTVPVLSVWCYDDDGNAVGAAVYFYIPQAHQAAPPTPKDTENMRIVEWNDVVVYNRAFGGLHPDSTDYDKQFEKLRTALSSAGVDFRTDTRITAGFTRPHDWKHRFEVMLLGTDEEPLAA